MRTVFWTVAFVGTVYCAPQLVNLDAIALDFPPSDLIKAPINVVSNILPPASVAAITPLQSISAEKREFEKRDGNCSPYPAGSGPVTSPDTPATFQSNPDFASMAANAPTPDGYTSIFNNAGASLQASNYIGLFKLTSYDTLTCALICDSKPSCLASNVYLERDPSNSCADPPSTTNFKCTLWGAPISSKEATKSGQYQGSFHVVIAGSNGYNKVAPPSSANGYLGPYQYGGAINAPPESNSYLGYQYSPFSQSQGFDPRTCADAFTAQTVYDRQRPRADGSFKCWNILETHEPSSAAHNHFSVHVTRLTLASSSLFYI